uniref:Uncharacterized protein n=1 Tax=Arundo donax TaxID=35708 RepID=A0A0A9AY00_ARUDO
MESMRVKENEGRLSTGSLGPLVWVEKNKQKKLFLLGVNHSAVLLPRFHFVYLGDEDVAGFFILFILFSSFLVTFGGLLVCPPWTGGGGLFIVLGSQTIIVSLLKRKQEDCNLD